MTTKQRHLRLAGVCLAISKFLQPLILLAIVGGLIGAWRGNVPWWWGFVCAAVIWLLVMIFIWVGKAALQRAMTPDQERIVELTVRSNRGETTSEEDTELRHLLRNRLESPDA